MLISKRKLEATNVAYNLTKRTSFNESAGKDPLLKSLISE